MSRVNIALELAKYRKNKTKRISFRVNPDLLKVYEKICKRENKTSIEMLEEMILRKAEEHNLL